MSRRMAGALIALVVASSLGAQEKLFESVEVHVVNVDVVVTDRDGRPVTGLTREDFEVSEDGARQTITNFSEYRENAAPQPQERERPPAPSVVAPPPRRFLLFIDNSSLDAAARKPVCDGLRRFVTSHLRAGDEAAVVAFDHALRLVAPMTADRAAIAAAIDGVAATPPAVTASNGFVRVQRECLRDYAQVIEHRLGANVGYELCMNEAQQQTTAEIVRNRRLLGAMNIAVTTMGGLDGRKALIVAGSALSLRPGYELFMLAKQMFAGLIRGFPPIDDKRFESQTDEVEELARHASSYDVTLYFMNASQAIPSDSIQNAIATPSTGGSDFLRVGNTQDAYQRLADDTGGLATTQRSVDTALASIERTLDSYYSIGYKPANKSGSEPRAIKVSVRNRDYTVHARRTFTLKSAAAQMADRVVANIYAPQPSPHWPVDVRTGEPKREGRNHVITLDISIPASLTMLPQDGKLIGGFALYVAVGSEAGAMSSTFREPHGLSIAPADEAAFRARSIPYHTTLTLSPGRNFISVGVLDLVSNSAGFARATVVIP